MSPEQRNPRIRVILLYIEIEAVATMLVGGGEARNGEIQGYFCEIGGTVGAEAAVGAAKNERRRGRKIRATDSQGDGRGVRET